MPAKITILGMRHKNHLSSTIPVINTCSNSPVDWQLDLSPFKLGPCPMYVGIISKNMENAWQYSKVYKSHLDINGQPNGAWWLWAASGWNNPIAIRYPMGRGAVPEYSFWDGKKLGYIDARKTIYGPLYRDAVQLTQGWKTLQILYQNNTDLVFRDFDGYDHDKLGLSLSDVLNNPKRKMGHAFVLKMLLTNDPALGQFK